MSVQPAPGVGASFLVPRTAAASTAFQLVGRRLTRALRIDRSLGYVVNVDYRSRPETAVKVKTA